MNKLKIIFFGTPAFVVPVLQKLQENFEVVGVVAAPDKKVGRKQILTPSPIKSWSIGHNIPALSTNNYQLPTTDLFVVAAFGRLIPQEILDIPKFGALNIHPSLLPKYRGPSPIQNTILSGDKTSGLTIIKMDKEMDHGPVVSTKEISLSGQDTFDTLSKKMFELGAQELVKITPDFVSGKIKPREQDHSQATYTHIIRKEDGYFEINNPPPLEKLDRMIRAYYPWPTAWTRLRPRSATASRGEQGFGGQAQLKGKIIKFLPNRMVQLEGKKPVPFEDFLRGHPNFPLKIF